MWFEGARGISLSFFSNSCPLGPHSFNHPSSATGFGLSREILHDAGLRANGRKDDSVSAPQGKKGPSSTGCLAFSGSQI